MEGSLFGLLGSIALLDIIKANCLEDTCTTLEGASSANI